MVTLQQKYCDDILLYILCIYRTCRLECLPVRSLPLVIFGGSLERQLLAFRPQSWNSSIIIETCHEVVRRCQRLHHICTRMAGCVQLISQSTCMASPPVTSSAPATSISSESGSPAQSSTSDSPSNAPSSSFRLQ